MKKKNRLKGLIFFATTLILIFAVFILVRNVLLVQIKQKINSSLKYNELFFSSLPPALVIEEAESHSSNPYFSAKKISVSLSLKSIISRGKPLKIVIEEPELKLSQLGKEPQAVGKKEADFTIPVFIEKLLLKSGKVTYETQSLSLHSEGINAVFSQNKNNFTLYSEVKENDLYINKLERNISGNLSIALSGRGRKLTLQRFHVKGPDGIIKAGGSIDDIFEPEMELTTSSLIDSSLVAVLLRIPFNWSGNIKEKGTLTRRSNELSYRGELESPSIDLNRINMGKVNGRVGYTDKQGGHVTISLRDPAGDQGDISIDFNKNGVRGRVHGVTLQPIANEISIPWPVYSKAWGEFSLVNRKLIANADFRDSTERIESQKFPLNGPARVEWDGDKDVLFSSPNIKTSFGDFNIDGSVKVNRSLDITLKGGITDLKQAREFTGLVLRREFKFPELRGNGEAEIHIFGDPASPQVKSDFSMSEAGFNGLDAEYAKGTIELIKNDFFGRFDIEDPTFKGTVGLFTNPTETRVEILCERGETGVVLPALNISLPIQGQGSGSFEYIQKKEAAEFNGVFTGKDMDFAGQALSDVRGRIKGDDDSVEFPELNFNLLGGRVEGSLFLNTSAEKFNINFKGKDMDLSSISENLKGVFTFDIKGEGKFNKDFILGSYDIRDLEFASFKKTGTKGKIKIGYDKEKISIQLDGNFVPGENDFLWKMDIPLNKEEVTGKIEGSFRNLDILLPWKGTKAELNYLLNLRFPSGKPEIKGVIDFQGSQLPFPHFAHALEDFSGLVFVDNGSLSIRSVKGILGGGTIEASGNVRLGNSGFEYINMSAHGDQMMLSILERTRALTNGDISLIKDDTRFVVNGDFFIEKLLWRRELNEGFSFSSEAYPSYSQEPGFFDDLNLNIRLRADKNAWMENSLGSIQAGFDLNIKGSIFSPIIQGEIEAINGTVYFQDREFNVLQGRVSFFNPASIDPYLNFKGETYVKNYHVTFSLDGPLSNLRPEFNSSPSLPSEDVLALLALGQAFRRTYHYDRSIGQSTASLLSFQLSEEAKKRAEELFKIDRFRIDPFIMGSSAEMTARLTLGKKLSKNFFILYSTNLAAQREDITRIEWELSNDFSIVGTRDEAGRISFDVKIHRRF
jgi:hypothetical protein